MYNCTASSRNVSGIKSYPADPGDPVLSSPELPLLISLWLLELPACRAVLLPFPSYTPSHLLFSPCEYKRPFC